jgi:hypothetical protein
MLELQREKICHALSARKWDRRSFYFAQHRKVLNEFFKLYTPLIFGETNVCDILCTKPLRNIGPFVA